MRVNRFTCFLALLRACFLLFFLLSFSVFFSIGIHVTYAATVSVPTNLKIFYYKDGANAEASLFAHYQSIDVLAPQAYQIDATGALVGSFSPGILNFAKAHNIKVMPLVTNEGFGRQTGEAILNDTAKQDKAIAALVAEAQKQGYWGWQVDFEGMDASYRDRYSAFIQRMSMAMKNAGLVFSVAVVAQISDKPSDYPNNLWNRVIGVYDYAALGSSTDFVSVMSYDDPGSKGPVARYPWLKQVIQYSLQSIPANKLSLGIPFYYWKWNDNTEKLVDIGGNEGIQTALKKKGAFTGFSTLDQVPFIEYFVKKVPYTVWYENSESIQKKLDLVNQYNLQGFSAWALGLETPSVFSAIK